MNKLCHCCGLPVGADRTDSWCATCADSYYKSAAHVVAMKKKCTEEEAVANFITGGSCMHLYPLPRAAA